MIWKLDDGKAHVVAANGGDPAFVRYQRDHPISPDQGNLIGRVMRNRQTVYVPDVLADPDYTDRERQRAGRFRTVLAVPLLREGEPIGVINLIHNEVKSFTDKQIELLETFADQAVIAIENVRLFDEVQARTRDLAEALEQQTATSEVLQVISSSPGELEPVFERYAGERDPDLRSGLRHPLAERRRGLRVRGFPWRFGGRVRCFSAPAVTYPDPEIPLGRVAETKQVVHITDLRTDPAYLRRPTAEITGGRWRRALAPDGADAQGG